MPDFLEPDEMLRTEAPRFFVVVPLELAVRERLREEAVFLPLALFCAVARPELRELLVLLRFALRLWLDEREVLPRPALVLRPVLVLVLPDFAACLPEAVARLRPRSDAFALLSAAMAVSRLTILLKLLRSPEAV